MSDPVPVVGQRWGYRARTLDRLVPVDVLRIGTKRPLRVLIRFVGDDHEGHEEWVPPARLKVPWSDAPAWQERDDRWQSVREASGPIRDTTEEHAAWMVYESDPRIEALVELGMNRDAGVLQLLDPAALCTQLGLDPRELEHPAAFQDGDRWVVPWPVTEKIMARLARHHAANLLPKIRDDEEQAAHEALWGTVISGTTHISAEICRETDARYAPARELVRRWCGREAVAREDELTALRAEVVRLGRLAEQAVSALRDAGAAAVADRLERDLGVPVDTIRAQRPKEPNDADHPRGLPWRWARLDVRPGAGTVRRRRTPP